MSETDKLLKLRTELVQKEKKAEEGKKKEIKEELEILESKICEIVAMANRNKVIENFGSLRNSDGRTNTIGVWKIVRKVFPKNKETLPFAIKDLEEI